MCRVVIRPLLLRPPVLGLGTTSDFSGVDRVTSAKSATEEPRRPGVVGLYLRIAIALLPSRSGARGGEDVDALAVGNAHDGPLGVGTTPGAVAGAPLLARPVEGVDPGDVDLEHRLDGDLDLGLVGVGRDEERVLVLVQQAVALLAHHGGEQDVAVVADLDAAHESSSLTLVGPVRGAAVLDGELASSLTLSSSSSGSAVPRSRPCATSAGSVVVSVGTTTSATVAAVAASSTSVGAAESSTEGEGSSAFVGSSVDSASSAFVGSSVASTGSARMSPEPVE